ncbi:hypothetical protein [Paraburkholderia unamae]|uniref:hypothetical protein n=1 Tax=Paraburkholderia unamae TaxID=219649 RepID=UPI0011BD4535|nr:hypothetical protein [Paraburkholderia unamae]
MTKSSDKQMSDGWIRPRIGRAVGDDATADMIKDEGYEAWLMVVDENGKVTSITRLDEKGNALLDATGKPVTVPVN